MDYIFINTDIYSDVDIDFTKIQFISTIIVVPKLVIDELSNNINPIAKKALNKLNEYRKLSFFLFDTDEIVNDCNDIVDYIRLKYSNQADKFLLTFVPELLDKAHGLFPHIRIFGKNREFDNKTSEIIYPQFAKTIQSLADKVDLRANYYMGYCYRYGYGVPKDLRLAGDWFKKSIGELSMDSLREIGDFFYDFSKEDALLCYTKCADNGDVNSQIKLANYYWSVNDYNEAVKWFEKASENDSSDAQLMMGYCYFNGIGVTQQSYDLAFKYYQKSAN
ncbi:MAG: sel1 repeat family protein [Bacteroidales bacterium]|nr:sel1 repeat family protein [Bacteroidales bacterium]